MKNRKKLLAILLLGTAVSVSALALSACSNNCKDDTSGPSTSIPDDPDVPLGPGGCKHDGLKHVPAAKAGCVTSGNVEYWFCNDCGKYYSDSALTVETSLASVIIGAVGHNYGTLIEEQPSTCENAGVIAHYHCSGCNGNFNADKKSVTDLSLPLANHTYGGWIEEEAASCTENGVKAHKDCTVCKKHFDAENHEITDLDIAASHNYGTLIEEVPAVGCNDGKKAHYHCDICGTDFDEYKEEFNGLPFPIGNGLITIPAPHNIKDYPAEEASCTVDGHGAYRQCEDCKEYFDERGNKTEAPMFVSGDHDYSDFVYDYVEMKYVKTCKTEATHPTVEQAAGTEEYPYLAKDEATLNAALLANKTTETSYIKLTDDIVAEDFINIGYYDIVTGYNIDLNGKTLTSNVDSALCIDNGANVIIKNGTITVLGYYESSGYKYSNGILIRDYYAEKKCNLKANVTLDGVTVNATATGINGIAVYVSDVDLTVKNSVLNSSYVGINNVYSDSTITLENTNITSAYGVLTRVPTVIKGGEIRTAATGVQVYAADANWAAANLKLTVSGKAVIAASNENAAGIQLHNYSKAEISDSTISGGNTAIGALAGTEVVVNNCTLTSSHGFGIAGNGGKIYGGVTITLNTCTIEAVIGIYHPQIDSKLTVNGGTITASQTAIEVRAGEVEINNATLTSTSKTFGAEANGSGSTTQGIALTVSQHTTNDNIVVTVNGSKLNGIYSIFEKDLMDELTPKDITINLGEGNTYNGCVYSENCANLAAFGANSHSFESGVCTRCGETVTVVSDADELLAAIEAGGDIILATDINLTEKEGTDTTVYYAMRNDTFINLNGHKITTKKGFSSGVNDKVTFEADLNPKVTVVNGTIERVSATNIAALSAADCGELLIVNCTIISTGDTAVSIFDQGKITAYDSTFKGVYYGFSSNAGKGNYSTEIYAKLVNCNLDAQYAGLMWNIPSQLVVDNCDIKGIGQALIARGGSITVSNTTLTKRAGVAGVDTDRAINGDQNIYPQYDEKNWDSGSSVPGYALVVGNRSTSYQYKTNITLTNVDVIVEEEADAGKYVYAYGNTNSTAGEPAYGATITYDKDCNLGTIVIGDKDLDGGSSVTVTLVEDVK